MKAATVRTRTARKKFETLEKEKYGPSEKKTTSSVPSPRTPRTDSSSASYSKLALGATKSGLASDKAVRGSAPVSATGSGSSRATTGSFVSRRTRTDVSKSPSLTISERMSMLDKLKSPSETKPLRSSLAPEGSGRTSSRVRQSSHFRASGADSKETVETRKSARRCQDGISGLGDALGMPEPADSAAADSGKDSTNADRAVASQGDSTPLSRTHVSRSHEPTPPVDVKQGSSATSSILTGSECSSVKSSVSTPRDSARKDSGAGLSRKDSGAGLSRKDSGAGLSRKDSGAGLSSHELSETSDSRKSTSSRESTGSRKRESSLSKKTSAESSSTSSTASSPRPRRRKLSSETCSPGSSRTARKQSVSPSTSGDEATGSSSGIGSGRTDSAKSGQVKRTPSSGETSPSLSRKTSTERSSPSQPRKSSTTGASTSQPRKSSTASASPLSSQRALRTDSTKSSQVKRRPSSGETSPSQSRKSSTEGASPSQRRKSPTTSASHVSSQRALRTDSTKSSQVKRRPSSGESSPSQSRKSSTESASPSQRRKSPTASAPPLSSQRALRTDSTKSSQVKRRPSSGETSPSRSRKSSTERASPSQRRKSPTESASPSQRRKSPTESASPSQRRKSPTRGASSSQCRSSSGSVSPTLRRKSRDELSDDSEAMFDDLDVNPRLVAAHQSHRISVAPTGRKKCSRNPIKALQDRPDVVAELEPSVADVGKQVFSKSAQLAGMGVSVSASALAGLASKENVSKVKLSTVTDVGATMWPKQLLIRIKGRRSLQTRVVEPTSSSVNSGDSFLFLDAASRSLFQFIGKTANVVERAKSADMSHDIFHGKDCGCKAPRVTIVEEGKISSRVSEGQFWSALASKDEKPADLAADDGDDITVEKELIKQTVVYKVLEDDVVVCEDLCGKTLKYAMLDPTKVMIFDFINEVVSWTGRRAPNSLRRNTASMVKTVFDRGYTPQVGGKAQGKRSSWALQVNCKDGSESVLFRSKFHDWPDPGKLIKTAPAKTSYTSSNKSGNVKSVCAVGMRRRNDPYPGLIVLQRNLGRGRGEAPSDDPCLPGVVVKTVSVKKWYIKDNSCQDVQEDAYADFFDEDTYIVRWVYSLHSERSNIKSGIQSKQVGSDQTIFFFWQGNKCRVNEKGTSALIVIELSGSEGDPQIRVAQGAEPPAFLQMFDGAMTIHSGSYSLCTGSGSKSDMRLYAMLGQLEHECHLEEIASPISAGSLRSRHCAIVVDVERSQVYAWHGKSAPKACRSNALKVASMLASRQTSANPCAICPQDKSVREVEHGDACIRLDKLLPDCSSMKFWDEGLEFPDASVPRAFLFGVASGSFDYTPLVRQWRTTGTGPSFPAAQAAFYAADQPAIGFVEAGNDLFVWCGWMREVTEDDRGIGSVKLKWIELKKFAFDTAKSYLADMKKGGMSKCRATVVTAGYEPEAFRSLFLDWADSDEAKQAVGKIRPCSQLEPVDLEQELASMAGVTYPLDLLRSKPLPDNIDVDPQALEKYLNDADFEIAFEKTREEFNKIPSWKQVQLRKKAGLF